MCNFCYQFNESELLIDKLCNVLFCLQVTIHWLGYIEDEGITSLLSFPYIVQLTTRVNHSSRRVPPIYESISHVLAVVFL